MKKLLHIIATPRTEESRTLQVSTVFIDSFRAANPDCIIDTLDLSRESLPELAQKQVSGKYALLSGKEPSGELKSAWDDIVRQIERFLAADIYLISTPMWNFSVPYKLKHYIDVIIQPKFLFQYTASGVEGLAKGKKMAVIISRGGDYSSEPMKQSDHQATYLKTVFGFVGIRDIRFIVAEGVDMGRKQAENSVRHAQEEAAEAAKEF